MAVLGQGPGDLRAGPRALAAAHPNGSLPARSIEPGPVMIARWSLLTALIICLSGAAAAAAADASAPAGAHARNLAQAPAREADVIVIGAGMAGMTAARDIAAKLGAGKVIVLEARQRVGGRCAPYPFGTAARMHAAALPFCNALYAWQLIQLPYLVGLTNSCNPHMLPPSRAMSTLYPLCPLLH